MSGEGHDDVCITCSDQLLRVVIDSISADGTTAHVRGDVTAREISLELVDGAGIGSTVLVHGGVALQIAAPEGR